MTPHSFATAGTRQTFKNDAPFSAPIVQTLATYSLSCDGPNPGNRVDPNNWGYIVNESKVFFGSKYYRYTNPPSAYADRWEDRGTLGTVPTAPSADLTDLYNEALSRLNGKVRGQLNLAVSLAESGQTVRMFRDLADLIREARSWRKLRKQILRTARDPSKAIANAYLQWIYGVRPLLSDIYGIAGNMADGMNGVFNVQARATERVNRVSRITRGIHSVPSVPIVRTETGRRSVTIRLAIRSDAAFDIAKWTSLNPLGIAWELLPYSFVADWVFNIGGYMENLETGLHYAGAFQGGYVSNLTAIDVKEVTDASVVSIPNVLDAIIVAKAALRYRNFRRNKLVSYPLPYPPQIKLDFGSAQLLSSAALLRQLLSRV